VYGTGPHANAVAHSYRHRYSNGDGHGDANCHSYSRRYRNPEHDAKLKSRSELDSKRNSAGRTP
jgi:hypothetical protein